MSCSIDQRGTDALWPALLACRQYLRTCSLDERAVGLARDEGGGWRFEPEDEAAISVRVDLESPGELAWDGHTESTEFTGSLRAYIPLLVGAFRARREERPFVIGHIAQTLDGRIACVNGQSQWISNEANLRHAHRLRALHDAVLVGRKTVERDDPQLTVRHVEGADPIRVVLSSSGEVVASERRVFEAPGALVLHAANRHPPEPRNGHASHVSLVSVPCGTDDRLDPLRVCERLYDEGVTSIFIEGGSTTISRFLEMDALDVLHVHVSPRILGSGVSSFALPEAVHVDEAISLTVDHFCVDGELMLSCQRARA